MPTKNFVWWLCHNCDYGSGKQQALFKCKYFIKNKYGLVVTSEYILFM